MRLWIGRMNPEQTAKHVAGLAMTTVAGCVTSAIDQFATWVVAGAATFFAVVVAQLKNLEGILTATEVAHAGIVFLWATGLAVVARYLAGGISAVVAVADKVAPIAEKHSPFDALTFFQELEQGYPRALRFIVRKSLRRAQDGDFSYSGRMLIRLCMIHGCIVLAQTGLILWALGIVFASLGVKP